jgi:hypothetical protein
MPVFFLSVIFAAALSLLDYLDAQGINKQS